MKIVREGVEIELTYEERLAAYHEQQAVFDADNISENFSWIKDQISESLLKSVNEEYLLKSDEFIQRAAEISRDLQDSEDYPYTYAMVEAVRRTLVEMERFVVGQNHNTKDWFVYDNRADKNVLSCDTEKEAWQYVFENFREKE